MALSGATLKQRCAITMFGECGQRITLVGVAVPSGNVALTSSRISEEMSTPFLCTRINNDPTAEWPEATSLRITSGVAIIIMPVCVLSRTRIKESAKTTLTRPQKASMKPLQTWFVKHKNCN